MRSCGVARLDRWISFTSLLGLPRSLIEFDTLTDMTAGVLSVSGDMKGLVLADADD